jgi:hypothetical protein
MEQLRCLFPLQEMLLATPTPYARHSERKLTVNEWKRIWATHKLTLKQLMLRREHTTSRLTQIPHCRYIYLRMHSTLLAFQYFLIAVVIYRLEYNGALQNTELKNTRSTI